MARPGIAALRYTAMRLGLFIASAVVLYLVGMRGFLLWAVALLSSGALALVLLRNERDEMSAGITKALGKVNSKFDEANAKEDESN
ncbi:MAG: hypothetical protein RL038_720 [Actinomycetota bacterium]